MDVQVFSDKHALGAAAAAAAVERIRGAIAARGAANIILATGTSQFDMLSHLVNADIAWACVTAFHLDEYIGIGIEHPASFRRYLRERFERRVPALRAFHYVDGTAADPAAECRRLGALLREHPIDVACVGIGENGHLAFNDPPADFETEEPFLVVALDEACRRQQLGEGWFATLDDVPRRALSMSCRQIMKSRAVVCPVPDERKAEAVRNAVEGPVTNRVPASILQRHPDCRLMLDGPAASRLAKMPA